jgi:hypothetical protein
VLVNVLVQRCFNVGIDGFRPFINDEAYYWHQIATFQHVGFGGGYYTVEEQVNPANIVRFGFHGPVYPILYGAVARVTGWYRSTPVLFNGAVLALSVLLFVALVRPPPARLALLGGILITYWPVAYWIPTAFQETFHHAGALLVAAIFTRALGPKPSSSTVIWGWFLLTLLALVRPSWMFLMPAWAICTRPSGRGLIAAFLIGTLVAGVTFWAFLKTAAPYARSPLTQLGANPLAPLLAAFSLMKTNIERTNDLTPFGALTTAQVYVFGASLLVFIVALVRRRWTWLERGPDEGSAPLLAHLALHAFNVTTIVAGMLMFYSASEYRILAPAFLTSALLLAVTPRRGAVVLALGILGWNVAVAPVFLSHFRETRKANFVWDRKPERVLREALQGHVRYDPHADPWCNTLLTSQLPPELFVVPAGVGISSVFPGDRLPSPLRSKYLLLDERALSDNGDRGLRLQQFGSLPYGRLYINLDASCPP